VLAYFFLLAAFSRRIKNYFGAALGVERRFTLIAIFFHGASEARQELLKSKATW